MECRIYDCVVMDAEHYFALDLQVFGAKLSEGVFVGSFLSMSSTAVVCFHCFLKLKLYIYCVFYRLCLIDSKHDLLFTFTIYQVVKFLVERNSNNALHVQVTIGTLIFQVSLLLTVKW